MCDSLTGVWRRKMRRCVMKEWWTCCSGEAGEREIVGWEWELV